MKKKKGDQGWGIWCVPPNNSAGLQKKKSKTKAMKKINSL